MFKRKPKKIENKFRERDPHVMIIVITKDKPESACINSILAQDYKNYAMMVHTLPSRPVHSAPLHNAVANIVRNRNLTRRMALASDADFFFLVDCDVVLPPTALSSLLLQKKDFIGGWYPAKLDAPNIPVSWPTAVLNGNLADYFDKPQHSVHIVDFTGLGCVLISRRVFEKVEFRDGLERVIKTNYGTEVLSDDSTEYCFDVARLGYKIYMNGDVICKHLAHKEGGESYPKPEIVKPRRVKC